jgi:hypothetical protein
MEILIMATVQTDGSSAVTTSSTVNNGGVAQNVGTSTVLTTRALGTPDRGGVFGSTPVDSATKDYADKALSAGTFKAENQRGVIQRVTSSLAGGVANTFLTHAADDASNARSIHRQEKVTTTRTSTAIRAGYWNTYTGQWSTPPTTATDNFWDIANDTTSATSTDEAATPTRAVPGELTYKLGNPAPVSVDYKAKTG